jgi:ribosomal protein L11 methyltransferase
MGDLVRVVVRVGLDGAEAARARMIDVSPEGFEEIEHADDLELVVYADAAGLSRIQAAFPGATAAPLASGWQDAWRAFHRPVVVGGIWIGPPWELPPVDLPAVVIDPGQAFGTGAHPTTRLCADLLGRLERGSVLDVGCGSGVLAIAAAKLGFTPVTAIDDDPVAVEVTVANAALNHVAVDARVADATRDPMPSVDVALANVLLAPVEAILARVDARTVVTSGYLVGELPAHPGWRHSASIELDGWAADLFRHPTV